MKNRFPDLRAKQKQGKGSLSLPGERTYRSHISVIIPGVRPYLTDLYKSIGIDKTLEQANDQLEGEPESIVDEWRRMIDVAGRFESLVAHMQNAGIVIQDGMILEIELDGGDPVSLQVNQQRIKWIDSWPGFRWTVYLLYI